MVIVLRIRWCKYGGGKKKRFVNVVSGFVKQCFYVVS